MLDPVVTKVRMLSGKVLRPQGLRDVLHGVPTGHPLHPALVALPLGSWVSASVLDALPFTGPAAPALILTGLAGSLPAAAAGLTDWSDMHEQQQRVGLVHSAFNTVAIACYTTSLVKRARGRHLHGKGWALAGLVAVGVGGYIGGHLTYRQAGGVNHIEDVPHRVAAGWHALGPLAELPDGAPAHRTLGGVDLVVVRRGQTADVLAGLCSHLSGPLWDGDFADGCITCPWHRSTFDVSDGGVVHGPATAPQSRFDTRVSAGILEVCLPGAG